MPRYFKIVEHLNVPLKAHSVDSYAHPLEFEGVSIEKCFSGHIAMILMLIEFNM